MGQESCNSRMCKFCTLFRTRFGIGELLSAVSQTEVHSSILSHTHTHTHAHTILRACCGFTPGVRDTEMGSICPA